MKFGYPEYGRLRTVLMHTPGKELSLVSPKTYEKFLFGDAINPEQFRKDHERFVEILRSEGVNVALITGLLRDQPELLSQTEGLPNLMYTRDTSTITPAGYVLTRMKSPVRRKETTVVEAALRQLSIHPLLKVEAPATLEGGDMIFLDEEIVLLGTGNRTNQNGLQQLARIGRKSGLRSLLAVPLPSWVIHLDGTMMIVDRDLAIVHRRSLDRPALIYEGGKLVKRIRMLEFLKRRGIRLLVTQATLECEKNSRITALISLRLRAPS